MQPRSPAQLSHHQQRGLQLFEVVLLVALIGLLMFVAGGKVMELRSDVERSRLQQVVDDLNATLALEAAGHVIHRRREQLMALHHSNPVSLLEQRGGSLDGYIGERYAADPLSIDPGQWYFERSENLLIYRVRHARFFQSPLDGPARARFRAVVEFEGDADNNASERPGGFRRAALVAAEPYQWRAEQP